MTELGTTDDPVALVPGSPAGLHDLATHWSSRSDTATDAADRLAAVTIEAWTGDGAVGFATRRQDAVSRWTRLADACSAAASAIDDYASTLTWAQGEAAEAIELWRQGQQADAAGTSSGWDGSMFAESPDPDLSFTADPGDSDRVEATRVLAEARRQLAAAGDTAASALRTAATEPDVMSAVFAAVQATTSPAELLQTLDGLSAADIGALLRTRPDLAAVLAQNDPSAVAPWWQSLDAGQQDALVLAIPEVIGALGGVAYSARDRANRVVLADQIELLTAWEAEYGEHPSSLDNLLAIEQALVDHPDTHLVEFDPAVAPPTAAVATGDLDTADHVAYQVYGMTSSTMDMPSVLDDARRISDAMTIDAQQLGMDVSVATVSWIGYDSPDYVTVALPFHALAGADALATSLDAFDATRRAEGPLPFLSVDTHSYASDVVANMLYEGNHGVDQVVMYGAPGVDPPSADLLNISSDSIWTGRSPSDLLAPLGIGVSGRSDTLSSAWGAQVFGTAGDEVDPLTGELMLPANGHSEYLAADTESLRNIALLNLDRGDLVTSDGGSQ